MSLHLKTLRCGGLFQRVSGRFGRVVRAHTW